MRCTQVIGLSPQAQNFLNENQAITVERCDCPDCKTSHVRKLVSEVYLDGSPLGMFDDGPSLYKHQLKDGSWVYEFCQASPWSSGPCIFLALSKSPSDNPFRNNGEVIKESLWTEEEINQV